MAAKLQSSLLCRPRELKLMWHSEKKNSHNKILPFIGRSAPAEGPHPTPRLSASLLGGVPAMVFWSGPISLRKCLAGGLDGTAPTVVTSIPIWLTGAVGDRLPVAFMTVISVFRRSSKSSGVPVLLQ